MARICHCHLYFFCGAPARCPVEHAASLPGNGGRIPFPLVVPLGNGNGIPPSFEPRHRPAVLKTFFAPLHVCFQRLNALRERAAVGNDENGIYGSGDRRNHHLVFVMSKMGKMNKIRSRPLVWLFCFRKRLPSLFLLPLSYPNNTKSEP